MPDSRLHAPLPVLRAPRTATAEEEGPSETDILDSEEYLVFPRSPSPEAEDLEYILESGENEASNTTDSAPRTRRMIPVSWLISHLMQCVADSVSRPSLPPHSSSRSMKNQNMRSRQTPGKKAAATSSPSKKSAASSSTALTCSLSSLSTSQPAPSDGELHKLANLAAPHKKETAGEHRVRSDENDRRLIVWPLTLQKLIEENEKSQSLRIPKPEHLLRHRCLKQLMAEGCDSI
ncbi:hypothetical protein B0H10DRAFT_2094147 [Mycena sp. CBHHK59/15]|nr:hypothetical protein B0H10DRAFT_2094147 [Mycena sp. CBHHK59/15]